MLMTVPLLLIVNIQTVRNITLTDQESHPPSGNCPAGYLGRRKVEEIPPSLTSAMDALPVFI
jgi:hypothetical protein